jgi:branched-chain amino acid transport system substrate-binding protein
MRRASIIASVLLLLSCSSQSPIKIGLLGPLSTNDGEPMKNAARIAVDEINAAGGIDGRPLELVERDDYGNRDSALAAAVALERAGVVAVIGSVYSSITMTVAPVFNNAADPVVQITPSSSSPAITDAGPYTFRLCPSDLAHGSALARFAFQRLNLSRAEVIYQNDEYGRGIRRSFLEEFSRLGGSIVAVDPYMRSAGIPSVYLQRMVERSRPEFIFVAGMANEGGAAMHEARSLGLTVPFMGGDGLSDLANSDPAAEGTFISVAYLEELSTPANQAFVQKYHARFSGSVPLNQSGAGTYDAINLLREVMSRVGTDRRRVRDAIAAVGSATPAFPGLAGPIAFDENGDVPSRSVVVGVVRAGKLEPVPVR